MCSKFRLTAFLVAALVILSGAEADRSGIFGGTLPLRGGTLPLRIPADGSLPLSMTGDASQVGSKKKANGVAMSVDIEIKREPLGEAAGTNDTACAQLFGPVWEVAGGEGLMLVGEEELEVTHVCSHSISGEVALVATKAENAAGVTCFMTSLTTSEQLTGLSGQLRCTDKVAGLKDLKFKLASEE